MARFRAAALTDIGRVRRHNEDRLLCDLELALFGVADGVGGLPGGAQAAELAVGQVLAGLRDAPTTPGGVNLAAIVRAANHAVEELGQELSPTLGVGTTLTIGCIRDGAMKIAHVGDSRCYVAQGREFMCLTEDHSVENEARLRRARGEVVYYHEANRNALTRCIGQPGRLEVDLVTRMLRPGDRYLFCSDGVTRMVPDRELGERVARHEDPDGALREIIKAALDRGGPDNATGVLVFIDEV